MQKYNVEALYKSANKILGNYIKEIQNKIDRFMSTQSKDVNAVIFRDYMANGQEWYNGYTIYESDSKIGLYVYFYNAYDAYDDYSRVINKIVDEEISIGDYVLTGGEIPAMVLIDSVSRYVDGVLSEDSTSEESFSQGILEYPQYTRPETFEDVKVPEILLSGHHENINKWRRCEALKNTYLKRPELLENVELSNEDKKNLEKIKYDAMC